MKKYFLLLSGFFILFSCEEKIIDKPDNLIEKDVMVDVMYDLALIQALRGSNNQATLDSNGIDATTYVYKKYKIDSLQFAQSNRYYASDVKSYNRMFNRVNQRIVDNKAVADSLEKKQNASKEKVKKLDSVGKPKKIQETINKMKEANK